MGSTYRRAHELCQSLDDDPRLFSVLSGLWSYHLVRGEHTMAISYTDEMTRLAPRMQNDGMLIQADWASGCSRFFKGQFAEAHASLERGRGLYDQQKHRALAFQFGQDPCVSCHSFDAMTLWILGYPDQAEKKAQEAIKLARDLGYPFTLTWCLSMIGKYYSMRRDYAAAERVITEGLTLTKEYGFSFFAESLIAYRVIGCGSPGKNRSDDCRWRQSWWVLRGRLRAGAYLGSIRHSRSTGQSRTSRHSIGYCLPKRAS